MKGVLLIVFFISFFGNSQELTQVRADFIKANGNKELTIELHNNLSSIKTQDSKNLVAYKGAVTTMMAKHSRGKKEKKNFFKEGVRLVELAVEAEPQNIEIRVIRLSIQENAPKFLKYNKNISGDKQFLLDNYKDIQSIAIREFVKSYVLQSKGFVAAEKDQF